MYNQIIFKTFGFSVRLEIVYECNSNLSIGSCILNNEFVVLIVFIPTLFVVLISVSSLSPIMIQYFEAWFIAFIACMYIPGSGFFNFIFYEMLLNLNNIFSLICQTTFGHFSV